MSISQVITPFSGDAPNSNDQTEVVFDNNANAFAEDILNLAPELNTWASQANATKTEINNIKSQTEALRNQASTSASSAATSATASANSASASASSATQASNHVASAQGIVNALGDTQYALSQVGLGFAGLVDGDLIVNYANPITNVTMSNGEISITF
jgi:hypothetical protein